MSKLGMNKADLKKRNRGQILRLIATRKASSRVELASQMGLTKTAISNIVTNLMKQGYLIETRKQSNHEQGRNPICLDISPKAPKYLGILIQRKYIELAVCDLKVQILLTKRIDQEWRTAEELMGAVYAAADEIMIARKDICAIGVASIGSLDVKNGKIVRPLYFHGIRNVEVVKPLKERYGLPVYMENDNQSAILAEYFYGIGRGYQDIFLMNVSDGVGCGIIANGKRYMSNSGYAPEFGHMSIGYHGKKCICGNYGCLEMYLRTPNVLSDLREQTGLDYDYRTFLEHTDIPVVEEILQDAVHRLASGLISIHNMLNYEIAILGMDSIYWPDRYFQMLEEEINKRKFGMLETRIQVKRPFLMDKAYVLGAASNAIYQTFIGEVLLEDDAE